MSPLKFRSFIALLCLAGMIWAIPNLSGTPRKTTGTVVGWTIDRGGRPVPDAHVVLRGGGGSTTARAVSLVDGAFAFDEIKPGPWHVSAVRPDVGVGGKAFTLKPGEVATVPIQLQPTNPTR